MTIIEQCHKNKMYMTLFRNLNINQDFYLEPDPTWVKLTKVSGGKAIQGNTLIKFNPTFIVFYK